ncbi:hypothetical protein [Luteimonas sp. R10]|uniref:hypothetical protein n=1 Tax=Luteimonas sp. R10 TaxID=3108176 RepID=UPI003086982F|nr:hypothetical protein U3649_10185 [Luteimonas sp. R10]
MAKPNYSFEKRQREIAKQKQKEEKRAKKLAAKKPETNSLDTPRDPPASSE